MKKQFLILLTILSVATSAVAQKEFKVAKASGHLILNINGGIIEGYSGNEIVLSIPANDKEVVDERAKGLRVMSGSGFIDNTGLGLDVATNGDEVTVNSVGKEKSGLLTIKVPQNIKVTFKSNGNYNQSDVIVRNLKSEIEISTNHNKIQLENNTGPMSIKTLYGSIDASFSGEVKGPVSIISVHGYVDVALPVATKVNVELSTSYGKLYASDALKIAVEKKPVEKTEPKTVKDGTTTQSALTGLNQVLVNGNIAAVSTGTTSYSFISAGPSSETIKGKLNGGGADMILKSNYKNVYLREK